MRVVNDTLEILTGSLWVDVDFSNPTAQGKIGIKLTTTVMTYNPAELHIILKTAKSGGGCFSRKLLSPDKTNAPSEQPMLSKIHLSEGAELSKSGGDGFFTQGKSVSYLAYPENPLAQDNA